MAKATPTRNIKVFLAVVLGLILLVPISALCVAILSLSPYTSGQILVKRVGYGGLCASGSMCEFSITVYADGRIESSNPKFDSRLSDSNLKQLVSLLQSTNFSKVARSKFTGTCPIAYDGLAYAYTFYVPQSSTRMRVGQIRYEPIELDTCKQDFDKLNTNIIGFIDQILVK